jgi:hypothetical protein
MTKKKHFSFNPIVHNGYRFAFTDEAINKAHTRAVLERKTKGEVSILKHHGYTLKFTQKEMNTAYKRAKKFSGLG